MVNAELGMQVEDWLAVVACAVIVAGGVSWLVRPGWLTFKVRLLWLDVLIVRSRVRNRWLRWRVRRAVRRVERRTGERGAALGGR